MANPTPVQMLHEMRARCGERFTLGLPDEVIEAFLPEHPLLGQAISEAHGAQECLIEELGDTMQLSERALAEHLQAGYVQFYDAATVNPYVSLAARGPWIVTAYGAVLHDSGGYGMLGMGHAPQDIIDAMSYPWVMANVMTPSATHARFDAALRNELGHARADGCPFDRFLCLNSGSESVTISLRIVDANTKTMTDPGGRYEGREVKILAMKGGFHGRTTRPARVSDSTRAKYQQHLASFADMGHLLTIEPNDEDAMRAVFAEAEARGWFIEAVLMEPVMGEGNPGQAITRPFYDLARELTDAHGSLLIIDSIQAGIRAQGSLSLVDYPGFEDCACPDMETWSKAINAGQYPLSVVGLNERASALYARGIYGNTMTTNPRALETGVATLRRISPELRQNIRDRGVEFVEKLQVVQAEFPRDVIDVKGTGLLLAAELAPERMKVVGFDCVEEYCRRHGVGVIHGGKNALRFTPHFAITSAEIDVVVSVVREAVALFSAAADQRAAK